MSAADDTVGLLRACAWCGQIRTDTGWLSLAAFVARLFSERISHGICPACRARVRDTAASAYVAIIDRARPGVYATLKQDFEGSHHAGPRVQVLWDRRHTERRHGPGAGHAGLDRRDRDRRHEPRDTWATLGFVLAATGAPSEVWPGRRRDAELG